MTTSRCPNRQTLLQYSLGECPDSLSDEVERHVTDCPACEDSIAQFDTAADTLMRHLPLAAAALNAAEPQPGWIDILRDCPPLDPPVEPGNRAQRRPGVASNSQIDSQLADGFVNYDVLGILGRGGMGVVFLARHRQLNRRVALKVVRPDAMSSDVARRRFQREIQILGGLNHPGIVMATDAGVVGRGAYLVMEWIDGTDLGRLVQTGGPLAIESTCEVGRQIAEALAAAHSSGVVHRDVKPSNTMVDAAGRVRLLDFGLAHMTRLIQETGDTSVGHLLGTLDYMAPEQADGEGQIDARSDLYALGAMMFFLLTGRPPHGSRAGRSILEHIKAISREDAPLVSTLRIDVPTELDELIARLLCRDPESRPQSATEVAVQLTRWAQGNLAARVAEFKLESPASASESVNSEAARQSLADLLGDRILDPADGGISSAAKADSAGHRRFWWRAAAILPLTAIALAAVVIILKTPQGTLRIESEVGGVSVELIDEKDHPRELTIKSGENETQLTAGQYRVRLTGSHDGLELDRDVITLRQGKVDVARISRVAEPPTVTATAKSDSKSDRLYQGRTESEWQRQFRLETDPVSKLDDAIALLSLASVLPAREQFDRILDVGEEIVISGWNAPYLESALDSTGLIHESNPASRWQGNSMERQKPYNKFRNDMGNYLRKLPFQEIEARLLDTIVKGSDSRAAFAASLLFDRAIGPINRKSNPNPAELQMIFAELDVPLTGVDRSAMCQLLRLSYSQVANDEQRLNLRDTLFRLATLLHRAPKSRIQVMMVGRLLTIANNSYGPDWSPELSEVLARLVLDRLVVPPEERNLFTQNYFQSVASQSGFTLDSADFTSMGGMGMGGGMGAMSGAMGGMYGGVFLATHYDKDTISKLRASNRHFLDAWIKVVNEYLEHHSATSANIPAIFEVVRSIETATHVYSDTDDWPLETTAKLLTQILRRDYNMPPVQKQDTSTGPAQKLTASMLLTSLVRISGRLPDFVVAGEPTSPVIVKKLNEFRQSLSPQEPTSRAKSAEMRAGLLFEAPYDAIKVVIQANANRLATDRGLLLYSVTLKELTYANPNSPADHLQIDPLLLLAVLADLTGDNATWDTAIGMFFTEQSLTKSFVDQLKEVLESSLKSRFAVKASLQQIAMKSKIEALRELRILDEAEGRNTPVPDKDPKPAERKDNDGGGQD